MSFESALKLLCAAGVSVVARAPHGEVVEIRDRSAAAAAEERAARAMHRRSTWTGRIVCLHSLSDEPRPARSKSKRFAAVEEVSRQAYAIAAAGQRANKIESRRHDAL